MKSIALLIIVLFPVICNSQIANIPDANFKNALINTMCVDADLNGSYESDADTNNDGEIQYTEMYAVQRLKVSNNAISDLTGIYYFYNIKVLICDNNLLTNLSITSSYGGAMLGLQYLDCSHNNLTSLNLYPNSNILNNLTTVNCSYNQINSLNISNTSLVDLNISNNSLSNILQTNSNNNNLVNLNISNNLFTTFYVDYPSLISFEYINNPITSMTYNRFSNNTIDVSNIGTLQSLTFNYPISVPSINLSALPNLNFLKVDLSTIQNDFVLANLPSLNKVYYHNSTHNLTFLDNLGFTQLNYGYNSANTIDIVANNFHISGTSLITSINLNNFDVVNMTVDNMPDLTSLTIPDGSRLQSISLNALPQMQYLEIGDTGATFNPNCIDLTIQNFNNLSTIFIKNINIGNLTVNSLPSLVNFTTNGASCDDVASSFTLSNLPLLYNAKILDKNLANLYVNNLNSLHDLEIYSTKLSTLYLNSLPQLYNFTYSAKMTSASTSLPMLTIDSFPNLHSIYLSRLNNGGLTLNNLPNLYSLVVTNDYPSTSYVPQTFNYLISNLPSLYYVQLDEIKTTNLTFSNVPSLNTLKMRESNIGTSYSFQNLSLESVFIDNMATLNNFTFNNLPNFKNLGLTDCAKIQLLNLGNTNTTLQSFLLTGGNAIQSTSITSLNFTNYPQLNSLTVRYNLTSLTLSSLPNLSFLDLSQNKLNSISLTNFPQLNELICNYIQPTNLSSTFRFPLTLNLPNLTKLNVNYNNGKLANLDLSNCPLLTELHYLLYNYTSTGTIPYINMKNGNSNFNIFESNPINNICVDSDSEKTVLQTINSNLSSSIFTTYCSFNPGGMFYTTHGSSLLDINNNGCDSNDIPFPMINLNVYAFGITSGSYFANFSGNYSLQFIAGQYTITPSFENSNYYTFSPSSINVDFPTQTSPLIQNFCVSPNGNHNDLEIVLLPITATRPGFDAKYKLILKNKGNQTQSGTVSFSYDDSVLDYVSSAPTFTSQSLNLLNWDFTNLNPFEIRQIDVTLNANSSTETPPLNSGNVLNYTAVIAGLTDETPSDNTSSLNQTVVSALDPNDKTCLEGEKVTTTTIGNYVHYMIHFQNTGTANAQNIVVKDYIDLSKFDISTLVPIIGSNSFYTRLTNGNQVEFIFENINLPFATGTNNGYISFKIKTKPSLVVGDNFSNQVNIYFDYNNPIVTNNFITTIIDSPMGLNSNDTKNKIIISPNPVKDMLKFYSNNVINKIEIYDIIGRIISSINIKDNNVDLSDLKTGTYSLKMFTDNGIKYTKILKE